MINYLFLILLAPLSVFAQEIVAPVGSEWEALLSQAMTLKGASGLAIAVFAIQAMLLLFRSPWLKINGQWKLTIVLALSLVAGCVKMVMDGAGVAEAIMSGGSLAALQILLHQLYKQFVEKKKV